MEKQIYRHSLSHIMAAVMQKKFKDIQFGIGPNIDNGFYYDFLLTGKLTKEELPEIEEEMRRFLNAGYSFSRMEISFAEASKTFKDQPFKLELIEKLKEQGEKNVSIYTVGEFTDLCAGPHVDSTSQIPIDGFMLHSVNGAYWHGDEKLPMMTRIYGYAFDNKQELDNYIAQIEEAKQRDHSKLGRELELFTTSDVIGKGLPILQPKGAKIIQLLQRFVEDEEYKRGYQLTKTPLLAKSNLYEISGHWQHYKEGMFVLGDEKKDKEIFALRPMTCPFQFQHYLSKARSYRELPMRLNETSTLFRNESSGEMHGLIRLRQFTISEGHIACTPEQLETEFKNAVDLALFMLKTLGLENDVSYRLSKWDENNKQKYIGTTAEWESAQSKMREIINNIGIKYEEADGEAAFYGPKLDIQIKNVYGKEDTLITIQIDFQLAQKFEMEYTDSDGTVKNPYVIHRTSIGCYERTLALLIEKYAGAFPFWLSPVQVSVLSISEKFNDYAKEVADKIASYGIRTELDLSDERLGAKIAKAQNSKICYSLVIGAKEAENKTISVRVRKGENLNDVSLEKFIEACKEMNNSKVIKLVDKF